MKNKNKTGFFPKRQNIYFINKTEICQLSFFGNLLFKSMF